MTTGADRHEILEKLERVPEDDFDDLILELAIAIWLDRTDNDKDDVLYVVNEAIEDCLESKEG